MAAEDKSAEEILGHIDALKFRSCLTLFAGTGEANAIFRLALDKYFDGVPDPLTIQGLRLRSQREESTLYLDI